VAGAGLVRVGGQAVAYDGPLRGPVLAIVRSSDFSLDATADRGASATLDGVLEESLFLGAHYRHYVRVGDAVLLADGPSAVAPGAVKLRVPARRLRVFPRSSTG
jgi:TOBE domain.